MGLRHYSSISIAQKGELMMLERKDAVHDKISTMSYHRTSKLSYHLPPEKASISHDSFAGRRYATSINDPRAVGG